MEIIGLHYNKMSWDNDTCKMIIEDGLLGVYNTNENPNVKINKPVNPKDWNFDKGNWLESRPVNVTIHNEFHAEIRDKYKYKIEYEIDDNKTQVILINPTFAERIEINYQLNPWWSGKDRKFNRTLFFVILSALLGFLGAFIIFKLSKQP